MTDYRTPLKLAIDTAIRAGEATLKYYHQEVEVLIKEDNSPLTLADLESNQIINEALRATSIPVLSEENKVIPYDERQHWDRFWCVDPVDGTKEFITKRAEYTVNIALIEHGVPVLGVVYAPVLKLLYFGAKGLGSYKNIWNGSITAENLLNQAHCLKLDELPEALRVVASRSHLSDETSHFIEGLASRFPIVEIKNMGSSLKLCLVAEGEADIYPRLGPTMEWDTAAAHAVALYAGAAVIEAGRGTPLTYNKENLRNPYFIVYHPGLDQTVQQLLEVERP